MIIKNDVFDIAKRVKEIDSSYFIVFNNKNCRFELHGGKDGGHILTLPFDRLDERTIVHVRKTRIERLAQIIKEIEENNQKVEQKALHDAKSKTKECLEEATERVLYEQRYH